jgi:hypothetical protein
MSPSSKDTSADALALRITVVEPPPEIRWALQLGRDALVQPAARTKTRIAFDFTVEVVAGDSPSAFRLRGPAVQGKPGARFVYLCIGAYAGQAGVPGWRAKISLEGITRKLIEAAKAKRSGRLEARFAGTAKHGGPACASVPLLGSVGVSSERQHMFDWLKWKGSRDQLPEYAAIRKRPNRDMPLELKASEAGETLVAQGEAMRRALRAPPGRPKDDSSLFMVLIPARQAGFVTFPLPDQSMCLPVFSSFFRAADYKRTVLANGPPAAYRIKPEQFVAMLRRLRELGINQFTLDRCPRCSVAVVIGSTSVKTADDAMAIWSGARAADLVRLEMYLGHARLFAQADNLEVAREVALETVAHVSPDDPRVHLLLGQIAVALGDRQMLREAKAHLRFLKHDSWEQRLDESVRSGTPDFATDED